MAGLWGVICKVSANTLSSAAGTGAVLGVHSAFVPSDSAPKVMDSQLFNPTFETNKSLIDLQLGESGTYFVISISALALALVGLCAASYCGCSPSARRARRERAEYNRMMKESRQRHLLFTQEMDDASERLNALNILNEKRKVENPRHEGVENGAGFVSTLGEIANISSSSDASDAATTSGIGTEREGGRDATRTSPHGFDNYSY